MILSGLITAVYWISSAAFQSFLLILLIVVAIGLLIGAIFGVLWGFTWLLDKYIDLTTRWRWWVHVAVTCMVGFIIIITWILMYFIIIAAT